MSVVAQCTWWKFTDRMTPFVDGISSPIMRQLDTGEELSQRELPVGALFAAPREHAAEDMPH
jgi:hypothetical protein